MAWTASTSLKVIREGFICLSRKLLLNDLLCKGPTLVEEGYFLGGGWGWGVGGKEIFPQQVEKFAARKGQLFLFLMKQMT